MINYGTPTFTLNSTSVWKHPDGTSMQEPGSSSGFITEPLVETLNTSTFSSAMIKNATGPLLKSRRISNLVCCNKTN